MADLIDETEYFELPTYDQMAQIWDDFLVTAKLDEEMDSWYTSEHDIAIDVSDMFLTWYDQRLKERW